MTAFSSGLVGAFDGEITMLEREIHRRLRDHRGYQTIQQLNGVGRTLGAIFVVEIGDVGRFPTPGSLSSWAGPERVPANCPALDRPSNVGPPRAVTLVGVLVVSLKGADEAGGHPGGRRSGQRSDHGRERRVGRVEGSIVDIRRSSGDILGRRVACLILVSTRSEQKGCTRDRRAHPATSRSNR